MKSSEDRLQGRAAESLRHRLDHVQDALVRTTGEHDQAIMFRQYQNQLVREVIQDQIAVACLPLTSS